MSLHHWEIFKIENFSFCCFHKCYYFALNKKTVSLILFKSWCLFRSLTFRLGFLNPCFLVGFSLSLCKYYCCFGFSCVYFLKPLHISLVLSANFQFVSPFLCSVFSIFLFLLLFLLPRSHFLITKFILF